MTSPNPSLVPESTPKPPGSDGPSCAVATGWGAWMRDAWEPEAPSCVRCGVPMHLNEGCEWSDFPELNLCHSCAIKVLEDMRPNNPVSHGLSEAKDVVL